VRASSVEARSSIRPVQCRDRVALLIRRVAILTAGRVVEAVPAISTRLPVSCARSGPALHHFLRVLSSGKMYRCPYRAGNRCA